MKIIAKELNTIRERIEEGFIDPTPNYEIKSFISKGSKFIRSKLALLYLKAYSIDINDDIYNLLVAGEAIHNASLLHDDVLDDADYRRETLTISKKISPKLSILSGDYLLSFAIENLLKTKNLSFLSDFKLCIKEMTSAEIQQFFLRQNKPTVSEYISICEGKTASLFATIIKVCAEYANLNKTQALQFGKIFGTFFQIKNDLNSDSAIIDKQNGIHTAIDILGIEKTNNLLDNYKTEMNKILSCIPDNIYKEGIEDLIKSL